MEEGSGFCMAPCYRRARSRASRGPGLGEREGPFPLPSQDAGLRAADDALGPEAAATGGGIVAVTVGKALFPVLAQAAAVAGRELEIAYPAAEVGIVRGVPDLVQSLFRQIAEKVAAGLALLLAPVKGGIAQQGHAGADMAVELDEGHALVDEAAVPGRPADALEPRFTCKLCEDTGVVKGRTCECVHKVMQQLRREEIEALSSLSISSFDTMELRYYPDEKDADVGESARRYMAGQLAELKGYADEFDRTSPSLVLLGNAGLGKTHAALAIAGEVLEKGFDVIYVSSPDFFSKLEALHFGQDPAGEEETLLRTAAGADLLILDDLGSEFNSSFLISTLYSLLNNRLGAKLPTIVTTNITDSTLLERLYTEKISSRLASFLPCLFVGKDIRAQKAAES